MSQPTATKSRIGQQSKPNLSVSVTEEFPGNAPSGVEEANRAGSVILSDDDLQEIGGYLGRNILNRRDLLIAAEKVTGICVDGVNITLEPALLNRLKSRCVRREYREWLAEIVTTCLREYAGL
jgi:hypothetical protein